MSNMHGTGGKRFFQAELRPPKVDPSFKNFQPKVTVVDSALGDWMYTVTTTRAPELRRYIISRDVYCMIMNWMKVRGARGRHHRRRSSTPHPPPRYCS